ncbi:hypothetical protein [Phycicoccus avicenniae]|uniref:hypothetical protein n=1 Tax=Phycicoccus avicenniae TaxID=2828860 RepID=UPI003D27C821
MIGEAVAALQEEPHNLEDMIPANRRWMHGEGSPPQPDGEGHLVNLMQPQDDDDDAARNWAWSDGTSVGDASVTDRETEEHRNHLHVYFFE